MGAVSPHAMIFLKISSIKTNTTLIPHTPRHWKVKLHSKSKTTLEKRWQKFHKNLIFSLAWSIQNFVRKKKQFVRKHYITWLIDLASKLVDVEKLLDFILRYVLLNIVLFFLRNFVNKHVEKNSIAYTLTYGCLH